MGLSVEGNMKVNKIAISLGCVLLSIISTQNVLAKKRVENKATSDSAVTQEIPSDARNWNGNYYMVYDEAMEWDEAEEQCESMGGHLVTITSYEEQAIIEKMVKQGHKNYYWLGMHWDENDDFSQWITGEELEYTNFDVDNNEPNNYTGSEDAVVIYRIANPLGGTDGALKWNDLQSDGECEDEEFFGYENSGFICEWEK